MLQSYSLSTALVSNGSFYEGTHLKSLLDAYLHTLANTGYKYIDTYFFYLKQQNYPSEQSNNDTVHNIHLDI